MKKKHFALVLVCCVALAAAALMLRPPTNGGEGPSSADGRITPITGPALLEHVRSLKSPVVLVNFWASWCTPCKAEFPELLQLQSKFASEGLKVVLVSIDDPPDLPAAAEFLAQNKVTFASFYKGNQDVGFIKDIYPQWQGSVPTSVLLSPELKVLDAWEGETTAQEFEQRLTRQLRGS